MCTVNDESGYASRVLLRRSTPGEAAGAEEQRCRLRIQADSFADDAGGRIISSFSKEFVTVDCAYPPTHHPHTPLARGSTVTSSKFYFKQNEMYFSNHHTLFFSFFAFFATFPPASSAGLRFLACLASRDRASAPRSAWSLKRSGSR